MTDVDRVAVESSAERGREHRDIYDWTATSPSAGVVETVATATGRDPLALPQLYDAVEADALDSLVRASDSGLSVTFGFAGCEVTAEADGTVAVQPLDDDGAEP